jgi:GAF domain-containing protein
MSPTPDSALADPQQVIAELRRELAEVQGRLGEALAERDEGEAQKVAMTEVLQVMNSSPGDLAPVFDAMIERATRLCDAAFGHLSIYDGELIHAMAMHGASPEHAELLRSRPYRPEPGTALYDLVQGAPYLHEADIRQSEEYRAGAGGRRILADLAGARTALWMSLRKEGTLLGVFTIYRQEVRPFSEKEIALLESFAAPAVIALENARLVGELRERTRDLQESLDHQIATSDVLKVINRSTSDLQMVLDTLVEIAVRLCKADMGALSIREGNLYRAAAVFGFFPEYKAFAQTQPRSRGHGNVVARVLLGRRPVHVLDIASDPEHSAPEMVTLGNMRTVLGVPLLLEGEPIGVIGLSRSRVEPFTEQQIELVSTFADQVVIAIENARLLTETREALEQQTATAEVLQVINSSPGDLGSVFDAILEKAVRLCEGAFGGLSTWDGERLHRTAWRGISPEVFEALGGREPFTPPPGSVAERLACGENVISTADATQDPGIENSPGVRALARVGGARSYVAVALRKDDRYLGNILIYRQEVRPFSDKQIALLQNFAAQAVIAMENARLLTETREALEQQTATAEVLQVINSSPGDLTSIFNAILAKAHALCGVAHGSLMIRDGAEFCYAAAHDADRHTAGERGWIEARVEQGRFRPPEGTPLWRVLQGERLVHLADAMADDSYHHAPAYARVVDAAAARTVLLVPLHKDDALLGVITAFRREVRPFSGKEVALLQNFAVQAVIAIENARLLTETREALEQQTATAEVLQVINSSPGDLAPVFEAILEKAHALCGAEIGSLTIYDGEENRAVATRGLPPGLADRLRQGFQPGPAHPIRELLSGARIVQVPDVGEIADPIFRASFDAGIRTSLYVPLRKDDRLLGMIVASRQEVRLFSDEEITLLENFAAQAVIAMENARLLTETREALAQQTATAEVLQVINSSPGDLTPVFDAMLEKTMRLCDARFGQLLTSADGEVFIVAAAQGPPAVVEFLRNRPPTRPGSGTSMERLARGERCVHIHDAKAEEAYRRGDPTRRALVDLGGCRTAVSVGLRKDGALLGAINVYRTEVKPFSTTEIALIENFAAQAVIAMENARLLGELRQRTEEVAELNRGLEARVAEQVDELGRVGRLKRFLAPQLAELIVSHGDEKILESHRREIVVVFCDLRGYTAFTETAEPEEVLDFLREYHGALGPLVSQFEGTLDQFSGDGIMVFFNDPVPIPDPAERAVKMAMAMREAAGELIASWRRRRGRVLGFGVGIAQGYATLGQIGFAERSGYTAIGTVCNLAARLCAEAKDGQILLAQRVAVAVEETTPLEEVGELTLKGLTQPVVAYNVPLAATQPALRVIEGGPQSV